MKIGPSDEEIQSADNAPCDQELEPPPGVSAWPRDGKLNVLEAGTYLVLLLLLRSSTF
jgi:hypothetical protein